MVEYDRLNATAPSDIVEEIKRIAEERRMSVSALVAEICTEYVEHIRSCVCTRCLMQVAPDARFCPRCGHPQTQDAVDEMDEAIREARASPEFRKLLEMLRAEIRES